MPHGHCYLWNPALVKLHVISDFLIAVANFSTPFTLADFVRRRKDLPSIRQVEWLKTAPPYHHRRCRIRT